VSSIICFILIIFNKFLGQTTEPLNYICPLNNTTTEFSLVNVSFSHSAFSNATNCSVSLCSSDNHNCRNSETPCFDYRTQNGVQYCAPAIYCSLLESCNGTCTSSSSVCVINTCCEPNTICLPLAFTIFCPLIGKIKTEHDNISRILFIFLESSLF